MSASMYLDRGGSVLAALHWSQVDHRLVAVNVYPGFLHSTFGGWINVDQNGAFQFGLSHRLPLGLGLGAALGS